MGGEKRSQQNKPHKTGAHAPKGQRHRHREARDGAGTQHRAAGGPKARLALGGGPEGARARRQALGKQTRDEQRAATAAARRAAALAPPAVVALVPLCRDADARRAYDLLVAAARADDDSVDDDRMMGHNDPACTVRRPAALALPRPGGGAEFGGAAARALLLPPPPGGTDRAGRPDPLWAVEVARCADLVILVGAATLPPSAGAVAGGAAAPDERVDGAGRAHLACLAAMGAPPLLVVAAGPADGGGDRTPPLKRRAAARRAVDAAVGAAVGGAPECLSLETPADAAAALRRIAALAGPGSEASAASAARGARLGVDTARGAGGAAWRRRRPQVVAERAGVVEGSKRGGGGEGTGGADAMELDCAGAGVPGAPPGPVVDVWVEGWVRGPGAFPADLPATSTGLGDVTVSRVEALPAPDAWLLGRRGGGGNAGAGGSALAAAPWSHARRAWAPGPDGQSTERLHEADGVDALRGGAEQTWPTLEEERAAEDARRLAAAEAGGGGHTNGALAWGKGLHKEGTSEYQAAWGSAADSDDDEDDDEGGGDGGVRGVRGAGPRSGLGATLGSVPETCPMDVAGMEGGGEMSVPDAADDEGWDDVVGDARAGKRDEYLQALSLHRAERAAAAAEREARRRRPGGADLDADDDPSEDGDLLDLPPEVPARARLAKYRGLASWRQSPWDPREGLPREYGSVWAFGSWRRADRAARAEARGRGAGGGAGGGVAYVDVQQGGTEEEGPPPATDGGGAPPGCWARVVLSGVPAGAALEWVNAVHAAAAGLPGDGPSGARCPPSVFGLLRHETRLTVMHLGLRARVAGPTLAGDLATAATARHDVGDAGAEAVRIAAKRPLLWVLGPRTFVARATLSEDSRGCDKHRALRRLPPGAAGGAVASLYCPATFGGAPALAFDAPLGAATGTSRGDAPEAPGAAAGGGAQAGFGPRLLASGAARAGDPDRVNLKRVVLRGVPARTHKNRCIVKYLFHSPEDVRWFRPVGLVTPGGRRGRIRGPVGTHGDLKALFDGPVQQNERIEMTLWKRQYPPWPESLRFQ